MNKNSSTLHFSEEDFPPEEMKPKQRCTGYWIPIELEGLGLNRQEQFILSIIDTLDSGAPYYCFASNKYLADKCELSESRISFYITKFKRMGLIEEVGFNGRRRILKSLKYKWFMAKEDSKKDLCVKPRSQDFQKKIYARNHELSMRESTQHIVKNNNKDFVCVDSPPVGSSPPHGKIIKKDPKGKDIKVSKEDLYALCVQNRKDWSAEEIEEVWKVLTAYTNPIRDLLKFCDGTIINQRKLKGLKNLNTEKREWNGKKKANNVSTSEKQSKNSKEPGTANATLGLHLADWKQRLKQAKKSSDS